MNSWPWFSYTCQNPLWLCVDPTSASVSCAHKVLFLKQIVSCEGDMRSEEAAEIVNKYHQLYIQHLLDLYNAHKDLYFQNRLSDLNLAE